MMLTDFEFTTAKILDEGQIKYLPKKGKYLDLEIGKSTILTLVLAAKDLLEKENCFSENSQNLEINLHDNDKKSYFLISKYPITQKQYYQITGRFQTGGNLGLKKPILVSWLEAIEFCDRLSQKEGREYRLPYEWEWEFACRAGSKDSFSFGNILTSELANFGKDSSITGLGAKTALQPIMEVGMFPPNDFGIYDMHGNIWEWCQDNNPFPNNLSLKIVRGGGYYSEAESCACSYRGAMRSRHQDQVVGFRVIAP
jgi:eukaryotic-like serine/threonine-protein kinase